jgi:hypothetical protein
VETLKDQTFHVASDGWHKKSAEQGMALINFTALLLTRSVFIKVWRETGFSNSNGRDRRAGWRASNNSNIRACPWSS